MKKEKRDPPEHDHKDESSEKSCPVKSEIEASLAKKETKAVIFLRITFLALLVSTATVTSIAVYRFTRSSEKDAFETDYASNADRIITSFHDAIERKLGAIDALSTSLTSYSLDRNQSFPFVTLPHFAARGSDVRVLGDALIVHWMPLVTDDTRSDWEQYALANRNQIDSAFREDARLRQRQDEVLRSQDGSRILEQQGQELHPLRNNTILDDGTGYHPTIWSFGSVDPKGDEPQGSGPYLPMWQRSPINGARQKLLNMNFANTKVFQGVLPEMINSGEVIMNRATIPIPSGRENLEQNLALSQFRDNAEDHLEDPLTFIAYPVFDTFEDDRKLAGVLATNVYWKLFFADILPSTATGFVCVLENSFNQTLSYLLDGERVTYLGEEDRHDPKYNHLEASADINSYIESQARAETRSYTTVSLNKEYGKYTLRIYPSSATEESFISGDSWVYTGACMGIFFFNALVFLTFVWVVERRQRIVMGQVIRAGDRAALQEREFNEFLAHEVRNPLSAALTAQEFISATVKETNDLASDRKAMSEDLETIGTSLHFIDEFLRSILDINRAAANKLVVHLAPTDLLKDVLEPVSSILHRRGVDIDVTVDCPNDLIVQTDCLRLKQIAMNLGRNSSKFVTAGFIRFRVALVKGLIELYVEDSGPGIPEEKRGALFDKFQSSLDVLSQGTGVGLSLCESLTHLLGGEIWLDDSYQSGFQDFPGARFVVQLNQPPLTNSSLFSNAGIGSKEFPLDPGNSDSSLLTPNGNKAANSVDLPEALSVLFVDDDLILRKLFSRSLKKVAPDWRIQECANGETALRLVESEDFDLIFMDQHMASTQKQLLGTETIRALRAKGVSSKICGLSANEMEQAFLNAGSDFFVLKPLPCGKDALKRVLMQMCTAKCDLN